MERFWLQSYPPGVPFDIDLNGYTSVLDFLDHTCARFPDHPGYTNFGTTLTFSRVHELARHFAAFLQNDLGLKKGQRLAIMLPNLLQYPVAVFGAMRAGLIIVNGDPLYTAAELSRQLDDSRAEAILFLDNFGHVVEQALVQTRVRHKIATSVGELLDFPQSRLIDLALKYVKRAVPAYQIPGVVRFTRSLQSGASRQLHEVELRLEDTLFLQYTGGTTGVSKGAVLTHGNIVANILQSRAWIGLDFAEGGENAIAALPMYHIFCMTANILTLMSLGIHNILITNPKDFTGFIKILKDTDFSIFIGVNTLFRKLLDTPGFDQVDCSGIKLSFAGGMAVTRDVAADWKQATGSVIVEAYGLTETSPAACINPLDVSAFSGSIGLPISSTWVEIKDDAGCEVATGEAGELCIKGPQVTQGYWNNDAANHEAFTADGFFRTGDIARIDERGYVYILDRRKNMILVSGFNVYPNEIEDIVCQHPDIVEAAAIGVPDAVTGETVKLFAVASRPGLAAGEIEAWCRERLTGYKVPREIVFIEELPKTNVGKISHKDLR